MLALFLNSFKIIELFQTYSKIILILIKNIKGTSEYFLDNLIFFIHCIPLQKSCTEI